MGVSFRRWVSSFLPLYSLALRVGGEPRGGPGSDGGTFEAAGGELSPALRSGSVPRTDRSAPVVGRHLPAAFMRPVPSRAAVTPGKGQDVATVPRGGLPGGRGQWALQARSCWGAGARCARRRLQPRIRHLRRWLSPRSLPRWPGPWEAARTGRLAAAAGVPPPAGTPGTPPPNPGRPRRGCGGEGGRRRRRREGRERCSRAVPRAALSLFVLRGVARRSVRVTRLPGPPLRSLGSASGSGGGGCGHVAYGVVPVGLRGPCLRSLVWDPVVLGGAYGWGGGFGPLPRRAGPSIPDVWMGWAGPARPARPGRHGFLLQESRLLEGLPSLPPSGRRVSRRWGPTGGWDREG